MALKSVYNGPLATVDLSVKTGSDGNLIQRVESIEQDATPVALSAGNSRFTVSVSTISLSSKLPGTTEEWVELEAQNQPISYWDDGKDPATTPGKLLAAGSLIRIPKGRFANFKMVRAAGADALCVISAYKSNLP
jgi:hypothetical protein